MLFLFVLLSLVNAACVVALVFQVCLFLRQKRYTMRAAEDLIDKISLGFDQE